MGIKIDQSCYFSAMKNQDLTINEQSIEQQTRSALHFQYGRVSYKSFSAEYVSSEGDEDRFDRKIKALPAGLWVLCETIYHVAMTVFIAIPKLLLGKTEYLQVHVFYLIRDGQELFGRVMSLFHDQYGLYYIQESQFQKSCYSCFLEEYTKVKVASPVISQPNIPNRHVLLQQPVPQSADIQKHKQDRMVKEDLGLLLKQIKQNTSDTKVKEKLLSELAEKHFANDDLAESFRVIKELIYDTKTKETFIIKVAEKYFAKGNLRESHQVIKAIVYDTKEKEKLLVQLAEEYFARGDSGEALKVIKEICYNRQAKENFIAKLAEHHFISNDLAEAFEVIKEILSNTKLKEIFLAKLADKHFANGDLDEAFKLIKEIYSDTQTKENFIAKLAEHHFASGNLVKAFKVIKEVFSNRKLKEAFLAKLANRHFVEQNFDQAFEVAQDICYDTQAKETLFILLLEAYHGLNQEDKVQNVIRKIVTSMLIHESVKADSDTKKMANHLDHFSDQITQNCYVQIKVRVYGQKKESALVIIKDEVSQKIGQFLQLTK